MAQTEELKATQAKNTLKPLGDRVLVRRLEAEEKLKGGIILPDTAKKNKNKQKSSLLAQEKKIKTAI
ncbi:hypothetical protein DB43_FF00050 [Parachlamydia acanthamoebae]|uniref:10 kDa chaperonin n=1 Tax=Parachlamydia acanthamoebae TaxID=83552 RepID=A0A0C1C365_9BACT|nr:hypothetical protein DB43_FF00050 [Parachlamydia acanthamoebae]